MLKNRKLPTREKVFFLSLQYHGFRKTSRRHNLKFRRGYVIPATSREDGEGIDCWVKMPRDSRLIPVQLTQRGVRQYRLHQHPSAEQLADFIKRSDRRVSAKYGFCKVSGIACALLKDYEGYNTSPELARSDVSALRFAVFSLRKYHLKI
jgi:hypothetical protein